MKSQRGLLFSQNINSLISMTLKEPVLSSSLRIFNLLDPFVAEKLIWKEKNDNLMKKHWLWGTKTKKYLFGRKLRKSDKLIKSYHCVSYHTGCEVVGELFWKARDQKFRKHRKIRNFHQFKKLKITSSWKDIGSCNEILSIFLSIGVYYTLSWKTVLEVRNGNNLEKLQL